MSEREEIEDMTGWLEDWARSFDGKGRYAVAEKMRKAAALISSLRAPAATPPGYVMVPAELTAENGAKAALSGYFSETFEYMDEDGDECTAHIPVSWTTIKEIHKAMVRHFSVPRPHRAPE